MFASWSSVLASSKCLYSITPIELKLCWVSKHACINTNAIIVDHIVFFITLVCRWASLSCVDLEANFVPRLCRLEPKVHDNSEIFRIISSAENPKSLCGCSIAVTKPDYITSSVSTYFVTTISSENCVPALTSIDKVSTVTSIDYILACTSIDNVSSCISVYNVVS